MRLGSSRVSEKHIGLLGIWRKLCFGWCKLHSCLEFPHESFFLQERNEWAHQNQLQDLCQNRKIKDRDLK